MSEKPRRGRPKKRALLEDDSEPDKKPRRSRSRDKDLGEEHSDASTKDQKTTPKRRGRPPKPSTEARPSHASRKVIEVSDESEAKEERKTETDYEDESEEKQAAPAGRRKGRPPWKHLRPSNEEAKRKSDEPPKHSEPALEIDLDIQEETVHKTVVEKEQIEAVRRKHPFLFRCFDERQQYKFKN